MTVDVPAAAVRLGVTPARVRMLIQHGRLETQRVGNAYLIDEASLQTLLTHERPAHVRAFARPNAWACAALADGVAPTWVRSDALSRLRNRFRQPGAPLEQWVARMRARASTTSILRVHDSQRQRLLEDSRAWHTATSASNLVGDVPVAPGQVALWVTRSSDLTALRRDFGLLPSSEPNVTIRVADVDGLSALGAKDSDAFRLIVAADLLDDADSRARRSGRELLHATLLEHRWERKHS